MENNFYIIDPYLCLCNGNGDYNLENGPTGPTGPTGLAGATGVALTGSTGPTGYTQSPSGISNMSVGGYLVVGSGNISTGPSGLTGTRLFTDLTQGINTIPLNYVSTYYAPDTTGVPLAINYNATSYYPLVPDVDPTYQEGGNGCVTIPNSDQLTLSQPGVYHISLNYTWVISGMPITVYLNRVPPRTPAGMSQYQTGTVVHAINILERVVAGQEPVNFRFEIVGGGTGTPSSGSITIQRSSFYARRLN